MLEKLISVSESACKDYPGMDFVAAKQEYDQSYDLMQLFRKAEPGDEERSRMGRGR